MPTVSDIKKPSIAKRIFYFPVTKIIIGLIVCIAFTVGGKFTMILLNRYIFQINTTEVSDMLDGVGTVMGVLLAYILLFHFYEKRSITELKLTNFWKNAAIGFFTGFILQSMVILYMYVFGDYSIINTNQFSYLLPGFIISFTSAITEEIIFRGIIFRITEEGLGSALALIVSALLFGLIHLGNPNSSLYSSISIAIEAGILLGTSYMYTRNLWTPIFLHFSWNFAEAGIYGAPISGFPMHKSLFTANFTGSDLITGGSFGPENAVQATVFCLAAGLMFFFLARRQNHCIKPFWIH